LFSIHRLASLLEKHMPFVKSSTALMLLLVTGPALASDLVIAVGPDAAPGMVRLTLPAGQTTGSFTLYLRNTSAARVEAGALVGSVLDSARQPVPGVLLEFLAPGSDKAPASWPVAARGQVRLLLKVSNLTQPGVYTGTIMQQRNDSTEEIASLTLERPGAARIKIQQAEAQAIKLTAASRDFSFPLTLTEQSGQADIDDLRVTLGPLTRKDGSSGLAARWSAGSNQGKPLAVKRHDNQALTLSGELPERTDYTSWLSLRYADQLDVYTVQLTRSQTAGITAREAADGKVTLQVDGIRFDRDLTLQTVNGQPEITDLRLSLEPLRRQDGKPDHGATLKCSAVGEGTLKLLPGELKTITLTGEKLEPVPYVSSLRFQYQGQTQALPLVITRVPLLQNLSVDDPGTVIGKSWLPGPFSEWLPCLGGRVDIPVVIHETMGQASAIYPPRLGTLQLVDQSGKTISVANDRRKLRLRELPGATPPEHPDSAPATRDLAGRGEVSYVFGISGLPAGSYRGKILVSGPDSAEVTKDFTINVKDQCLWSCMVILLGVVGSLYLYSWMRDGLARDLRSAAIARARETLLRNSPLPFDDPVRDELLVRLTELQVQNQSDKTTAADTITAPLKDIETRVELNRQGKETRERILVLLTGYPTDTQEQQQKKAAHQDNLDTTFEQLQSALRLPQPNGLGKGDADAPAKLAALATLFETIHREILHPQSEAAVAAALPERAGKTDMRNWSAADWYARIRRRNCLVKLAVVLLGTASGMAALYFPSATFGSWQDYLGAFLWGFGFKSTANGFLTIATTTGVLPQQH
jgi:hypothetical protein